MTKVTFCVYAYFQMSVQSTKNTSSSCLVCVGYLRKITKLKTESYFIITMVVNKLVGVAISTISPVQR